MEFKKCLRCGCFFVSNNDVCCNCEPKDRNDIAKLNSFLGENINSNLDIQNLSINTGINEKNINRFINNNSLDGFNVKL